MPGGRPSDYAPAIALIVCERLAAGESLRAICRDESMPGLTTIFRWMDAHEEFRKQYTQAREVQAELFADELVEISDDGKNDWMERNDPNNPGWLANGEHINRSRLRVDTRKWIASRILAKKYGDRTQVEHSGTVTLAQLIADASAES